MNMNEEDRNEYIDLTDKVILKTSKFAKGVALGTIIGSVMILYAVNLVNKAVASGSIAGTNAVLRRTGDRAHRIGDTAGYTLRSMRGKLFKGAKSIKRDIGKGSKDIRRTMHS